MRIPANSRRAVVDPGVEVGPATVVIVTPYANLEDSSFWVAKNAGQDTFSIRIAPRRDEPTPFGWLIVESEVRVIELIADEALRFVDRDGVQVNSVPVTPGERILFRIQNPGGILQNFYIGTAEELSEPGATSDIGVPDWKAGLRAVEWTVPEDISDLIFAATIAGHFDTMQGTFTLEE